MYACDFSRVKTHRGRPVGPLSIVGEYTTKCLAIPARPSTRALGLIEVLAGLVIVSGLPERIHAASGTEFTARAIREWLHRVRGDPLRPNPPKSRPPKPPIETLKTPVDALKTPHRDRPNPRVFAAVPLLDIIPIWATDGPIPVILGDGNPSTPRRGNPRSPARPSQNRLHRKAAVPGAWLNGCRRAVMLVPIPTG